MILTTLVVLVHIVISVVCTVGVITLQLRGLRQLTELLLQRSVLALLEL